MLSSSGSRRGTPIKTQWQTSPAAPQDMDEHHGKRPHGHSPPFPCQAPHFTEQLAILCERHCLALRDFTGERPAPTALDVGCGVGGVAFELARAFPYVLGVDSNKSFIAAAQVSGGGGWG